MVGVSYPNNYFSIGKVKGEGLKLFFQEFLDGLHGQLTSDIKVYIILFQNTLQGICLYFALVSRPQTINESNDFCNTVISACDIAATQAGNAALLNVSMDGFACEVQGNLIMIIH